MHGSFSTSARPHILLIDPDPVIRSTFGDALRELGYTVTTASHPAKAGTGPTPDLLVIDATLATPSPIPTLLLTQTSTQTQPPHSLTKPFRLPALVTAITHRLAQTQDTRRMDRQERPGALPLDPARG
jgi:DNA-binding response OmpR family regulator